MMASLAINMAAFLFLCVGGLALAWAVPTRSAGRGRVGLARKAPKPIARHGERPADRRRARVG